MAKKKKSKNPRKTEKAGIRFWNVWVECDSDKKGYFRGRDLLESRCGESSGSGTGGSGWDVSWHEIETEAEARDIARKAARFRSFVTSVRYYQDQDKDGKWGTEVYLKGKA